MKKSQPEVVFAHEASVGTFARATKAGSMRQLGPRLYTSNLHDDPAILCRRNVWRILAGYYPDALIADRTALELEPTADGSVFFISGRTTKLDLPGLKLRPRNGIGPLPGDYVFRSGLHATSMARAYVENMRPSRKRTSERRTLPRHSLEERLERFLRNSGETQFNRMRTDVERLGPLVGLAEEAAELSRIMGTLLGTKDEALESTAGRARRRGEPIDTRRVELFEQLHDDLRRVAWPEDFQDHVSAAGYRNRALFEAYFSNFIEGTEFEIEEAMRVMETQIPPMDRPKDGHDVLGTFAIVSDRDELRRPYDRFSEFEDCLIARHAKVMQGRPEERPGLYKTAANRAGTTTFVKPDDVRGTLREGHRLLSQLDHPLQRALFAMFFVSEVHPFGDGNGRVARIMMNAELVRENCSPILIPIVFRDNYVAGLKGLSHAASSAGYMRAMNFAFRYTRAIPWDDFDNALRVMTRTNALERSADAERSGKLLRLPTHDDLYQPAYAETDA